MMTTADVIHPEFSGRHPKLILISDIYRVDTEIAEAHANIARSLSKSILPLLPYYYPNGVPASGEIQRFCHQTFANHLDPDEAPHKVGVSSEIQIV